MRRPTTRRKGAAATELALVLPFLVLLFGAVLDFGRAFHTSQSLNQAAYSGAVRASRPESRPASQSPQQAAVEAVLALLPDPTPDTAYTSDPTARTVTVTVRQDFQPLTPILGTLGPVSLERTVTVNMPPQAGE